MFERFTAAARGAVVSAQEYADDFGHHEIRAEHLLLGTVSDDQGVPAAVMRRLGVDRASLIREVRSMDSPDSAALRSIGVDLEEIRRRAEETFGEGALERPRRQRKGLFGHRMTSGGHKSFTPEAKQSLELALREAVTLRHASLGTEHLLLGLIATDRGSASSLLATTAPAADRAAIRDLVLREITRAA